MNVQQLRDYLDALLKSGVSPDTPICIAANSEASEVDNIAIVSGPFREDPAPKMPAFLHSEGKFVFLETCDDYEWMGRQQYQRIDAPPVPEKEWAPGREWWLRDRR
ncbi:hypothetical protein [Bordetella flabilis]|uniref:Uncharacterized protein n=1 Tax=Bordetella flabilis TaxID=463014 RepID=A0A193GMZ9_9BORD|nr:hypothetical protein [Bordetella flabilis]ANN80871.1 hypothetical protein BAU07_26485 [Bordetella flabilis]